MQFETSIHRRLNPLDCGSFTPGVHDAEQHGQHTNGLADIPFERFQFVVAFRELVGVFVESMDAFLLRIATVGLENVQYAFHGDLVDSVGYG